MKTHYEAWILELCILNIFLFEDTYGYKMAKSNKLEISESTLYPVLRRLKNVGYLEAYSKFQDSRLRKFYSITPEGRKRHEELKDNWKEYKEIVDSFLKEKEIVPQ